MRPWLPLLAVAAIGGCGGPSTATSTDPMHATRSKAAPVAATTQTVSIKNFDFHPVSKTVAAGSTVRWVNEDAANHTVTGEGGAKLRLGNVNPGKIVQMRFKQPGTYRYFCEYHPNMHARIVVR